MSFGSIGSSGWLAKLLSALGVPTFDDGTGKQVVYKEEIIDLTDSNNFTAGEIKVVRFCNLVLISALSELTHSSSATPSSSAGTVPSWARPIDQQANIYTMDGSVISRIQAFTDGTIATNYRDWAGVATAQTSATQRVNISYNV